MGINVSVTNTTPSGLIFPRVPINFEVRIKNNTNNSITISDIVPLITPTNGAFNSNDTATSTPITIAAGEVAYDSFKVVFFGPTESSNSASTNAFDISATVYTSLGLVSASPVTTVTVSKASTTSPAVAGQFLMQSPNNSSQILWW